MRRRAVGIDGRTDGCILSHRTRAAAAAAVAESALVVVLLVLGSFPSSSAKSSAKSLHCVGRGRRARLSLPQQSQRQPFSLSPALSLRLRGGELAAIGTAPATAAAGEGAALALAVAAAGAAAAAAAAGEMAPQQAADAAMASDDASALRELKETIAAQAKEIEALKRQLVHEGTAKAPLPATHGAHGAHGGGGATEQDSRDYLARPFYSLARRRIGWLGLFLCSLSLTALIMNGFEHTLSRQIELAYFVPLLAGHGGNTGGQTVGTVLAALSSGSVVPRRDAPRVVAKEASSGLCVGLVLGLLVSLVARTVMGISAHVSTVVLFTVPLVSTIAATLASALPFACVALGLDPTVIAAPAMTSFVDVTGLLSYFLIARAVFRAFGLDL